MRLNKDLSTFFWQLEVIHWEAAADVTYMNLLEERKYTYVRGSRTEAASNNYVHY